MIDYNFFQKVESTHNYVKYSDTDSLFLNIPQIDNSDINNLICKADEVSKFINKNITNFMISFLLPKMGVNPKHNYTDFKNEIIIGSLLLLDVKKNYAYLNIASEGNILDPPKIDYTGISVVRNDSSKFTQYFLKRMIEDIVLNPSIKSSKEKLKQLSYFASQMKELLDNDILNYNYNFIGIPCKWGGTKYKSEPSQIIGMRLYNTITEDHIFGPMTSGLKVLIKIKDTTAFNTEISGLVKRRKEYIQELSIDKITNLVLPYNYDKTIIETKLEQFGLEVDSTNMWNTLFSTTCQRIVNIIKLVR